MSSYHTYKPGLAKLLQINDRLLVKKINKFMNNLLLMKMNESFISTHNWQGFYCKGAHLFDLGYFN